eukprot:g1638.t1
MGHKTVKRRRLFSCYCGAALLLLLAAHPALAAQEPPPNYRTTSPKFDHGQAGIWYAEAGQAAKAVKSFRAQVRFSPAADKHNAYANLGVSLLRIEDLQGAREALDRSVDLNPYNDNAWDNLKLVRTRMLEQKKNMGSALKKETTKKKKPIPWTTPFELGSYREFVGYLASPEFREVYWERHPVLIRTAPDALQQILSLKKVFKKKERYKVGTGVVPPHYRNVNFIPGAFHKKNTIARRELPALQGDENAWVGRDELLWGLKHGQTLQLLGASKFFRSVFKLTANLYRSFGLPSNVNVYITPPGEQVSLKPHTDFTCNFMIQLAGQKRWKLWVRPDLLMPTSEEFIRGRDEDEMVTEAELGPPDFEVVLKRGDVLYVPRGVFHGTSTDNLGDLPAEVGKVDVMFDHGIPFTWATLMGFHSNPVFWKTLPEAVEQRMHKDVAMRRSVDDNFLVRGANATENPRAWKRMRERTRSMMYGLVDELVDHTPFLERSRNLFVSNTNKEMGRTAAMFDVDIPPLDPWPERGEQEPEEDNDNAKEEL